MRVSSLVVLALLSVACADSETAAPAKTPTATQLAQHRQLQRERCLSGSLDACDARCADKEAIPCARLGEAFENGKGRDRDPVEARRYYGLACNAGDDESCTAAKRIAAAPPPPTIAASSVPPAAVDPLEAEAARMRASGRNVTANDLKMAIRVWGDECLHNKAQSCEDLGALHANTGDVAAATKAFYAACDLGKSEACLVLGGYYQDGTKGFTVDRLRAAVLFERACKGADDPSAADLGCYLYVHARAEGWADRPDPDGAFKLAQGLCTGSEKVASTCVAVGSFYEAGTGTKPDKQAARRYYLLACRRGANTGCELASRLPP